LPFTLSKPRLTFAALLITALAPRAASAVQSAELYTTKAYFYGRFEARIRFAPGEGVVSSFFLWRDGSSNTTSWNELDYEKINSTCHLQTNIWTGKGTQSAMLNTPTFNICSDYHTYAFEWTPDYIAWLIDGTQVRKVTGASVTEYTQNASQGMSLHFNTWAGNSTFGGVLDPSILPVHEYISWVQYSSYANNAFQMQWREEFNAAPSASDWAKGDWASPYNLSTHNMANVTFASGIATLSMTADNATGFTGTPPADPASGGTSGTGGASGTGGTGSGAGGAGTGSGGRGGAGGTTGNGGRGGAAGSASQGSGGTSSTGSGGSGAGGTVVSGTGGVSAGTAGNGAGGASAGTAGDGAGGVSAGTAGSGTGGPSGSGGVTGSAGTGQNTSGTGGAGTGTASGQAGSTGQTGGDNGCSCDAAAAGGGRAIAALLSLMILVGARRRSRRAANR
jgi:hypothetical protein